MNAFDGAPFISQGAMGAKDIAGKQPMTLSEICRFVGTVSLPDAPETQDADSFRPAFLREGDRYWTYAEHRGGDATGAGRATYTHGLPHPKTGVVPTMYRVANSVELKPWPIWRELRCDWSRC